jgi:hypothetical protein
MSRIKRTSPALIVAIVALVAALVVPAFALTGGEKRVVKKLAAGQVRKLAPGLSVANAETANAANSANIAETATAQPPRGRRTTLPTGTNWTARTRATSPPPTRSTPQAGSC